MGTLCSQMCPSRIFSTEGFTKTWEQLGNKTARKPYKILLYDRRKS